MIDDVIAERLKVTEGLELRGAMNVPPESHLAQLRHAIRQGHPQVYRVREQPQRIALVGGGPSLAHTEAELVALVHEGALLVTMNGAYAWCLERNLKPNAQIVLDARASTARFLMPEVPGCRYYVASQCHADVWATVKDYEFVGIYHVVGDDPEARQILDDYYGGRWQSVTGGTTVATRALGLLRMLGFLRFDLFGVDSCWMDGQHHAFPQPENEADRRLHIQVHPSGHPERARVFECAPWHAQQLVDFLQTMRFLGEHLLLHVHGDGLIAHAIRDSADVQVLDDAGPKESEHGRASLEVV